MINEYIKDFVVGISLQGEETNEFTNTLGEKIKVQICSTQEETSVLLCRVLDGRKVAADLLAKEVHSAVQPWIESVNSPSSKSTNLGKSIIEDLSIVPDEEEKPFTAENLAIWIDPIGELF